MPDLFYDVPVDATIGNVFGLVATSDGLAKWWSKGGSGDVKEGNTISLDFGQEYQWEAFVENVVPQREVIFKMGTSDPDWKGTILSFCLIETETGTLLRFEHLNWPLGNDHYRSSAYCWAMYLRCLKITAETGRVIGYQNRLAGI